MTSSSSVAEAATGDGLEGLRGASDGAIWSGGRDRINFPDAVAPQPDSGSPQEASVPASPPSLPLDTLDLEPDAVRERLSWARTRGHRWFVWPDVTPREWRRALDAIGASVAALVGGSERVTLRTDERTAAVGV